MDTTNEPMFKFQDNYGITVNLRNSVAAAELEEYKLKIGEHRDFALGKSQFLDFEIELSRKYKDIFGQLVSSWGGPEITEKTLKASNYKSNLFEYWMAKKKEKEHGKNTLSRSERTEESAAYSA